MRIAMTTVQNHGHLCRSFASLRLGVLAFSLSVTEGAACISGSLPSRTWRFGSHVVLTKTRSPNQAASGNGAMASWFHAEARRRAVPALRRWANALGHKQ